MKILGDNTQRDALARNLCARLCDEHRSVADLRRLDSTLGEIEREGAGDPLRVYVAGASTEIARALYAIGTLRLAGVEVVCTWPEIVAATPGGANPTDASKEQRFGWSATDLAEVLSADVLLFLVPHPATTRGAWFEAGVAWSHGKHVVFAGTTKQSVFCALGLEFDRDDDALAHVIRVGIDRARALSPVERGLVELARVAPDPDARFDFEMPEDA